MSGESPNKNDIEVIFKKLRNIPTNKECFDCNAKNPTWASVTFGVFICIDCSAVHRGLGVHLTFVRSTQLDTNWTWVQLRQMQLGGNANAVSFFNQHNCTTKDSQQKYNSRAAQLYREKLNHAAVQAMKIHGTKLFLDAMHDAPAKKSGEEEHIDFFAEHTNGDNFGFDAPQHHHQTPATPVSTITATGSTSLAHPQSNNEVTGAPSVEKAFTEIKPSSLGAKKVAAKKPGGLGGAKKLGKGSLGAQKVKTNFAELEKEAELADSLRMESSVSSSGSSKQAAADVDNENEDSIENISLRLAYQDISKQQKREEEKLKAHNPKKAEQMERLGMGFVSMSRPGGASHSVLNDSEDIQQDIPVTGKETRFSKAFSKSNRSPELDDWTVYNEGGDSSEEDFYSRSKHSSGLKSNSEYKTSSSWDKKPSASAEYKTSSSSWDKTSSWDKKPSVVAAPVPKPAAPAPKAYTASSPASTAPSDVQKKFGSAKSISSSQYFGDTGSQDTKSDMTRFEGSSSISSADYFGTGASPYGGSGGGGGYYSGGGYGGAGPDLEDVRESVRQGVTKVAGKLSSLANGVMSSIQEKYGGY
uniref:ADP-ribosylation factor GTPase-activating protein 2 n=1 Tax=Cacopsylla melanoneura TaxID=428564 RepID=A0A8D9FE36_9HEMI